MKIFSHLQSGHVVHILLLLIFLLKGGSQSYCAVGNDSTSLRKIKDCKPVLLTRYLQIFYPLENTEYSITICADVPVNNKPACVFKKGEPGHVFIILSKGDPSSPSFLTRSFGFYPKLPVSCLFRKGKSKITDNSSREYEASLQKQLTPSEFALILNKCIELAKKKYHLKKYNCYDYVLEVFNAIPGIEKLPVTYVKFPFILGKGGSPCGLYKDLKKLQVNRSAWMPSINFGSFKSPPNYQPETYMAAY